MEDTGHERYLAKIERDLRDRISDLDKGLAVVQVIVREALTRDIMERRLEQERDKISEERKKEFAAMKNQILGEVDHTVRAIIKEANAEQTKQFRRYAWIALSIASIFAAKETGLLGVIIDRFI